MPSAPPMRFAIDRPNDNRSTKPYTGGSPSDV
jgi:hypothetical protein